MDSMLSQYGTGSDNMQLHDKLWERLVFWYIIKLHSMCYCKSECILYKSVIFDLCCFHISIIYKSQRTLCELSWDRNCFWHFQYFVFRLLLSNCIGCIVSLIVMDDACDTLDALMCCGALKSHCWFVVARHEVQHYTNQLAKDTNKYIKDLTALPTPSVTSEQVIYWHKICWHNCTVCASCTVEQTGSISWLDDAKGTEIRLHIH